MPTPLGDTLPHLTVLSVPAEDNINLLPLRRKSKEHPRHSFPLSAKNKELGSSRETRFSNGSDQTRHLLGKRYDSDLGSDDEHEPAIEDGDDDKEDTDTHMGPKSRRKPPQLVVSRSSSVAEDESGCAAATTTTTTTTNNGDMNSHVELRRKGGASLESPEVTANLMSRDSFSLDTAVPETPTANNHGFFELSRQDQRNFMLLVLLYFLQGVPMGLAMGSVPFLLKPFLSYGQIGVFSLASYPYSLKLLWSPIVDAVWSQRVGRRKSWILPIQTISGLGMIWLGGNVQAMLDAAGRDGGGAAVWSFTGWWFFLVLMCATQDIAVDGWALTLISPGNLSYASTAQTVGLTAGNFMSYTVFLALNAKDFANRYLRTTPLDHGLLTLGGYLVFWGWTYIAVTAGLAFLKREERTRNEDGIWDVYKVMWKVLKLKNIQTIIVIHLIAKIGFQANDAVTNLKLIDKGFSQEDLALTVLIDFPFEMGLGYYAGKWSQTYTPMRLWCWSFVGRLVAALFAQAVVVMFPADGQYGTGYLLIVIAEHIFSTFTSTIMFVASAAFHAKIADPVIGGTYMTLLATVSNLGGTFPRFFVLKMVDAFTSATCIPPASGALASDAAKLTAPLVTAAFSCALEADKKLCTNGGGTCELQRDGYTITNIICVAIGVVTFWGYIKPAALKLQALPLRAWRVGSGAVSGGGGGGGGTGGSREL